MSETFTIQSDAPIKATINAAGHINASVHTNPALQSSFQPQGVQGSQGSKGDKGDIGGTYEFIQSIPASIWNVNHNLGYYPSVTVIDSTGDVVIGEVAYSDPNNLIITFSGGFSGKAYLS